MLFAFGYLSGLLTATLVFAILAFFKKPIEQRIEHVQQSISLAGPRPRGFLLEPETEEELAREAIIEKNRAEGKDTPIAELINHE